MNKTILSYNSHNDIIKFTKIKCFNEENLFKKAGYKNANNFTLVFKCKLDNYIYKIYGKINDKNYNNFKLNGLNNIFMGNLIMCKFNNDNMCDFLEEDYYKNKWNSSIIDYSMNNDNTKLIFNKNINESNIINKDENNKNTNIIDDTNNINDEILEGIELNYENYI